MIRIRDATPHDAADIARIHIAASRHAERGLVSDAALDALDVGARERMWRRITTTDAHPVHVFILEDGRRTVGFSACGPDDDDDQTGEVHAVYVDPAAHGHGYGTRLLTAAEADLQGRDLTDAVLWVLAANASAIGFYCHRGWQDDHTDRVEMAHATQVRERRYRKRLG